MNTIDEVLGSLDGVVKSGGEYKAFCPSHEDKKRSLTVKENDGKLLVYCFAGCSFHNILSALNITLDKEEPTEEAVYDSRNKNGDLLYQVVRYYPKTFKQRRIVSGEYVWDMKGVARVLYNLPKIATADRIYFVEGEKDCINLGKYGVVSTTISGGASASWEPQYNEGLEGTEVAVIPDNDKAGRLYAERVAKSLYGWAKIVKIFEIGSKDISEWLETHNTDELDVLWEQTTEFIPTGAVTRTEFQELKNQVIYLNRKLCGVAKSKYSIWGGEG